MTACTQCVDDAMAGQSLEFESQGLAIVLAVYNHERLEYETFFLVRAHARELGADNITIWDVLY
jgi:hypothetical protein